MAQAKVNRRKANQARIILDTKGGQKRTSQKITRKGVKDLEALGLSVDAQNPDVQKFAKAVADFNTKKTQDLTQRGASNLNEISVGERNRLAALYRNRVLGLMELYEDLNLSSLGDQILVDIDDAMETELRSLRENNSFAEGIEVQKSKAITKTKSDISKQESPSQQESSSQVESTKQSNVSVKKPFQSKLKYSIKTGVELGSRPFNGTDKLNEEVHKKRWNLKPVSDYAISKEQDKALEPILESIKEFYMLRRNTLAGYQMNNLDDIDDKAEHADVVELFVGLANKLKDDIEKGISNGSLSNYQDELDDISTALELEIEYLNENGRFQDDGLKDEVQKWKGKKWRLSEEKKLARRKDDIADVIKQMRAGNIVVINDAHKGNGQTPFVYATLLMKEAEKQGVKGTLMIEGPHTMNGWTSRMKFDSNHAIWNVDAWQNFSQANAAQAALDMGWDVKSIDILPNQGYRGKTTETLGKDGKVLVEDTNYGDVKRQKEIGKRLKSAIENSSQSGKGKLIVFGTAHIEAKFPYSRGGSFADHLKSKFVTDKKSKKGSTKEFRPGFC